MALILPVFLLQPLTGQTGRHHIRLAKWSDSELSDTLRLKAADRLIRKSYWRTQPDSALLYVEAQQALAKQAEHPYWRARAAHNMGELQLRLADYDLSEVNLRQAVSGYVSLQRWIRAGQSSRSLGNTLRKQGRIPEALEVMISSLAYAENAGREGIGTRAAILNSLGNLYLNQEDFQRAVEHYEESLRIGEENDLDYAIAANLNNLSKVYTAWEKYDTARNYLARSLVIKRERNDLEGIANTCKNFGDIYMAKHQLDSAELYYNQAQHLQDSLGLRGDEASSFADLGVLAMAREDWDTAFRYCSRGWEQSTTVGDVKVQVKCGDCLYQAQQKLGQATDALVTLEETFRLRDSFLSASNTRMLEEIEARYAEDRTSLRGEIGQPWYVWFGAGLLLMGLTWLARKFLQPDPVAEALPGGVSAEQAVTTAAPVPPTVSTERDDEWIAEVTTLIHEELCQRRDLTAANLAQQLATSERQLLRRCRRATGKTVKQFIQEVRLDYARDLINDGRISTVAELADAVGFKSPNYFSKRFAARFGDRPSKWLSLKE